MSITTHKGLVYSYFEAVQAGDIEKVDRLFAADATQWVIPGTAFSGTLDRDQIIAGVRFLIDIATAPIAIEIIEMTAEDNRVSVMLKSSVPLKNGKTYKNDYHMMFYVNDGLVFHLREYFNPIAVNESLSDLS
ncbi:hypothetical protein D6851_00745 [Altericroceibacterium spongiae]|uniref:SnoaL-like domain-containing protein n=1 Tax=Altericroceibacterium spongiae TaxID=2320269 RepID=A0A420EQU5_9SPHN|nr:nuclear transport factor 2 family protein [Altericroceibacterium spongiae]RKF23066.1 hypothetical protein D6851_00745 [Altericroceibacterium spongiae]